MSTKSTSAPQYGAQLAEATKVFGTVHSTSPGPSPSARQATCSAEVALLTATRMRRADTAATACLEARDRRTLGQEIRAQHFGDRVDVGLRDVLPAVGDHRRPRARD